MPEMNNMIRAASRRTVVAVTEPEPPAPGRAAATADAGAGTGGDADRQEPQARVHPVKVAVRDAFRRKG